MDSTSIFRKQSPDDIGEQMPSLPGRDSSGCVFVSGLLKTFSCDSAAETTETFNPDICFGFDSESGTITATRLPNCQTTNSKDPQDCTPIVTPQRPDASVVEISLDPLPESQIHPLLSGIDNEDRNDCSESALGLLFPLADSDGLLETMKPVCNPPSLRDSIHEEQRDDETSNETLLSNLQESFVYKQLRSSLPLPESFGSILCLLLHMESSPSIERTALQKACKIFNEQWREATSGSFNNSVEDLQKTSSKIVDEFVDALSPAVDFPLLFQGSARTYQNFSNATQESGLSIFFRERIDDLEIEEGSFDTSTTSILTGFSSGQKRKLGTIDEEGEDNHNEKKPAEFLPTVLELAIAYGVKHSIFDRGLSDFGGASLQDFVTETARRLQSMSPTERKTDWNHLVEILQGSKVIH